MAHTNNQTTIWSQKSKGQSKCHSKALKYEQRELFQILKTFPKAKELPKIFARQNFA